MKKVAPRRKPQTGSQVKLHRDDSANTLYDEGIADDLKLQDMLTPIRSMGGFMQLHGRETNFWFSMLPLPDLECKWKKGQYFWTQENATANQEAGYKQHGGDS